MTNQKISRTLFYIFIFFLPWQTRIILTPEKPEFLSFSIYLSEIFLWLALAFWLTSADLKKIRIPRVFMFLCFYALVSISWSPDRVAAFRLWLYIFDGIMVCLFLREHENMRRTIMKIFLFSLFIAALFGVWQFFNLGSPAWKWLGLASRSAWNLGDIVMEAGGGRWLRAYGPFPHPNIFGGYLAVGILLLIVNFPLRRRGIKGDLIIYFLGAILFFALFLTFSRSAWLALAVAPIYFLIKNIGGREIKKFFAFLLLLAVAFSIIFWPFVRTRAESAGRLEAKSNAERLASWKSGAWISKENFWFGTGAGNYTAELKNQLEKINYANPNRIDLAQPAHNLFLLVLSELGIFGFLIYLLLWRNFWKNPSAFTPASKGLVWGCPFLILFFVIGFFDHYLWTLYSGQMLFFTALALSYNIKTGGDNGSAGN